MLQYHLSHNKVLWREVPGFTDRCIVVVACYLRFVTILKVGTWGKKLIKVERTFTCLWIYAGLISESVLFMDADLSVNSFYIKHKYPMTVQRS